MTIALDVAKDMIVDVQRFLCNQVVDRAYDRSPLHSRKAGHGGAMDCGGLSKNN